MYTIKLVGDGVLPDGHDFMLVTSAAWTVIFCKASAIAADAERLLFECGLLVA